MCLLFELAYIDIDIDISIQITEYSMKNSYIYFEFHHTVFV